MNIHKSLLLFLAMLTAWAWPASAGVLYEQNFESVSDAADTGWTYGGQSMSIESDMNGRFIRFNQGQNNGRSAQLTWGTDIFMRNGHSLIPDGMYRLSYDFSIAEGSNNQYNSAFTVFTNHQPVTNQPYRTPWSPVGYWQNYLFDMSQAKAESYEFAIDGGTVETVTEEGTVNYEIDYSDTKTFEPGTWYTVTLDVDVNARTVKYSVESLGGELIQSGIRNVPLVNFNGDPISMYAEGLFIMIARYQTIYEIDNIKIEIDGDPILPPPLAAGDDFEYEGLWYTVLDEEAKTVKTKEGVHTSFEENTPGNVFNGELNIPSVVFYGDDSYTVVEIGAVGFTGCAITSVSFPESVRKIGEWAFARCENLASVSIPDGSLDLGEHAFRECLNLISVHLPENLTRITSFLFTGCEKLSEINMPRSLISIGDGTFNFCAFTSLEFPEGFKTFGETGFNGNPLKTLTLPASITAFGSYVFLYCRDLEEVNYLAEAPVRAASTTFSEEAYKRAVLKMPNATLASVQNTLPWNSFEHIVASDGSYGLVANGDDFEYEGLWYTVLDAEAKTCKTKDGHGGSATVTSGNIVEGNLTIPEKVSVSGQEYEVIGIGAYGFAANSGIISVSIPESVTSIGDYAFFLCDGMESLSLPSTLTSLGERAFSDCVKLASVKLPSSLKELSLGVFQACHNLTTIEFSEGLESIGAVAFESSGSIRTLNLPSTLVRIEESAFAQCNGLREVHLPASLRYLGSRAFFNCVFSSIRLPGNLEEIGERCFSVCKFDTVVYEASSLRTVPDDVFNEYTYQNGVLKTPNATLASVQAVVPWNKFLRITASDGSVAPAGQGEDFEYDGIIYRVLSVSERTCTTKPGGALPEGRDGNIGELTIPQTVSDGVYDYTITAIGSRSFEKAYGITSVSIPASVTIIASSAFLDCSGLTAVSLSEGLQTIDKSAFMGCTGLLSVDVPQGVTSLGAMAFDGCSSIVTATLPESLTTISEMLFTNCSSLETVNIPARVTTIGNQAFLFCERLSSIVIPDGVTFVGYRAFEGCKSLASLVLPESLTEMENSAFYGCSGLTSLTLPASLTVIEHNSFNGCSSLASVMIPESVTDINTYAFRNCSSMKSVTLPSSLSSLGEMVFADSPIETVDYNATSPIVALDNNFDEAVYANATLNMPNATLASVQAVVPWNKFGHIVANDGSYGFAADGDDFEYEGILYTVIDTERKTCKTKEGSRSDSETIAGNIATGDLVIPATVTYDGNEYTVVEIGRYSFWGNTDLTSVSLPETVKASETDAFEECTALTKARFASMEALCDINFRSSPSNPLYLTHHLYIGDEEVTNIVIPESVTAVKAFTFTGGSNITSVTFHEGVTSIGSAAFDGCSGLIAVELPESVASIGEVAFANCSRLTSVILPADVTSIRNYAFSGCDNIATVTYNATEPITASENIFPLNGNVYSSAILNTPNATLASVQATIPWNKFGHIIASDGSIGFVADGDEFEYEGVWYTVIDSETMKCGTKAGSIENDQFVPGNDYEGDLVVPASVSDGTYEYTVTGIGRYGFANAKGLTSITLPETITSIPESAFNGCSSLASVSIPETVTSVSVYAFYKCASLSEVKLPSMLTELGYSAFGGCESLTSIVIPESLTALQNQTFAGCGNLKEIDIPASITSFDYGVFRGCSADVEVTYRAEVPVEAREDLFDSNAYSNGTLNMPNATLAAVQAAAPWNKFLRINATDGSQAPAGEGEDFEYEGIWYTVVNAVSKTCKTKEGHYSSEEQVWIGGNLPEGNVNVPAIVSDGVYEYTVVEVGGHGFDGSGVVSVNIPETVTSIGTAAFFECYELTSVSIPENVTYIGENAFDKCVKLESVHLPDGLTKIEANVFQSCTSLSDVNMPSSLRAIEIGAFNQCAITNLELPDGLQSIGFWAFQQNPLVSVTIPASLLSTEEAPFNVCYQIQDVTYLAQAPVELTETLFPDAIYETAVLHAPNATLESIRATAPWNMFVHIMASDGSVGFVAAGDEFDFGGIKYAVIDPDAKTCKTMDAVNRWEGDLVIPAAVSYNDEEYSVTEIGHESFAGSNFLLSVTLPGSIISVGENAFADCERLTSLVWTADRQLSSKVVEDIANSNLLVYVNSTEYAPEGLDHNVVAADVCTNLVLTPGCPFTPVRGFTAEHSEMTKSFTQQTPIEGCAGWETLALPFEPTSIKASDGRSLAPFAALTDIATQCPFWLYEADAAGEWKEATAIRQSIPYLISMPNNEEYSIQYCIDGDVTFSSDERNEIAPSTTAPYAVTWNSGREFRSLWIPLTESEASKALGLNVGISDLTDDEGQLLAPGSAFHADVTPKPMEAYVTRIDARRSMPVRGGQVYVGMLTADDGLRIAVDFGSITITSDRDRTADVMTTDGIVIRHALIKAGETCRIDNLTRGIYLVAGRKITVK